MNLILGSTLIFFSFFLGLGSWIDGIRDGVQTATGTQFVVSISFISGLQMLLSFVNTDVNRISFQSKLYN